MTRIIAYIDGFNLYHAIQDLNRPALKWTNLYALIEAIAREDETVCEVNYFSAFATWMPSSHAKHRQYVAALEHAGVTCHMGHFKVKDQSCRSCNTRWQRHEEKESDVHMGARIVFDALEQRYDRAIIITADSDLKPAIDLVRSKYPKKQLFVAAPPRRRAHARGLNPQYEIPPGKLASCPLPDTIKDPTTGRALFSKPANWI